MTTGDSNDKVAAILDDADRQVGRRSYPDVPPITRQESLAAMLVIELKRIADHLAAISESGPR